MQSREGVCGKNKPARDVTLKNEKKAAMKITNWPEVCYYIASYKLCIFNIQVTPNFF